MGTEKISESLDHEQVVETPGTTAVPEARPEGDDEIVTECGQSVLCGPGIKPARCIGFFKTGWQKGYMGGKPCRKVALYFELAETIKTGGLAGERYRLTKIVTGELYERSGLVRILRSWFGVNPIQDAGTHYRFKISDVIGKYATLVVAHEQRNGKTIVRIADILPARPDCPVIESSFNPNDPRQVPEFIAKMIREQLPDPSRRK